MSQMSIAGGHPLSGTVRAQGAKNAALPIMAASLLLSDSTLGVRRVPQLDDMTVMRKLLASLGIKIESRGEELYLTSPSELSWETPERLVRLMRASSLVLGPLLSRCGKAKLPLPGGCAIGSRPIDLHLKGFAKMGADITLEHGAVVATAKELRGCRIYLDFPSVGATENLMMAATLARGETLIENAAREPEITNLAEVLRSMGADIRGEGTGTIHVKGKRELQGSRVEVIPDRIEACTYLLAGIMTGGSVTVCDIIPEHMDALVAKLEEMGLEVLVEGKSVTVPSQKRGRGISLKALPYPGFPTDLQPQMTALLSLADGTSVIQDGVFESRFLHINELQKMGADIRMQGNAVVITGVPFLNGADVVATDLRAGAALVLAGLAAKEETRILNMGHVHRGYENLEEKFRSLGAQVKMLPDEFIPSSGENPSEED
ncbi:MAG TPA: UDP-N-acetylglucosamine 1-carboxyvinyltransferase [Synergistaceae bacterium]|nr:UDP-N-acetylglucosamine 1-carboxyvinyltransferase [Synergistaceae bacterium]HPJ25102.1 UDP-N-acetylglucosamine 1-carboxyvinyltransferase [Synergistaceae bacterium]HPQ36581.1 UDP-N-acetylglucosamine 1-carboxyvinyltransferase [Synergistaceae bacterium]